MKDAISEFVNLVVDGREAYLEVSSEQAFMTFDQIGKRLTEAGFSSDKIIEMRHNNFSVTCQECGMNIKGDSFANAFLIKIDHPNSTIVSLGQKNLGSGQVLTTAIFSDGSNVTARGPGKVFRLITGMCINEKCNCSKLLMRWGSTN